MRYLLIPENNSLSHVAKCLGIRAALVNRGHEVLIAANHKHSRFLQKIGVDNHALCDIQEIDGAPLPTTAWFKHPRRVIDCINAEVAFLKKYNPHRVLGVFRFTTKASALLADIPYDSLICGCMLPNSSEVLGYAENETGIHLQQENLQAFFQYAGSKLSLALAALGMDAISDIRHMLTGNRTFLWDFPEFFPVETGPNMMHVGPILWNGWPYEPIDLGRFVHGENPLAITTFGTGQFSVTFLNRILRLLLDLGYNIFIAGAGQEVLEADMLDEPRVTACKFAPLDKLFQHASLVVCHGGQMTVFEALQNRVPVVVMPFQPEQAHNGVCLERLGCGCRLVPPQPFRQNPWVYTEALNVMRDDEIMSKISSLVSNPQTEIRLTELKAALDRYNGADTVAAMLEVA